MFEVEGKLNAWLFCHLARAGLKNGWLMGFVAVCIVAEPATFWWRVPLLYLAFVLVATLVVRIAPEAAADGDKDWRETVENKKREIEDYIDSRRPPTQDVTPRSSESSVGSVDEDADGSA